MMRLQPERSEEPQPFQNLVQPARIQENPFPRDELLLGGSGDDDGFLAVLGEICHDVGMVIWWTLCCPCAFFYTWMNEPDQPVPPVEPFVPRNPPDQPVLPAKPVVPENPPVTKKQVYVEARFSQLIWLQKTRPEDRLMESMEFYDQFELLLKNIISELKKLEDQLKDIPLENQRKIKARIKDFLEELAIETGRCAAGKYNALIRLNDKLSSCPETLYNRLLILIQYVKEEIFTQDPRGTEVHGLSAIRDQYGIELGLTRDSVFLQDKIRGTCGRNLKDFKKLFNDHFTKKRIIESLWIKIHDESDVNKDLYIKCLNEALSNDPVFQKIQKNGTLNEEDDYTAQFQTKEGFTKRGVELLFDTAQDEEGHKISDLFKKDGSIDWQAMQRIPKNRDFMEMANDPSLKGIRLEELKEIWARVCK